MGLLRLLLALSVILAHTGSLFGLSFIGGELAVKSFYMISGFYMALILSKKYNKLESTYFVFITNRFLKLYPTYWIILLFITINSIALGLANNNQSWGVFNIYISYIHKMNLFTFILFCFANIFIFLQGAIMFMGLDQTNGQLYFTSDYQTTSPQLFNFLLIPQAWTIGIEISFYFIAPFLVRRKTYVVLLLAAISLIIRIILSRHGFKSDPWSYRFFPSELIFFLAGILAYKFYSVPDNKLVKKKLISIGFYVVITLFTVFYSILTFKYKYYIYLLLFLIGIPFIFSLSKNWAKDRIIGELSYPVYICHLFVFVLVKEIFQPNSLCYSAYVCMGSIMLSFVLKKLVSDRIENYRQKRACSFTKI